MHKDVLIKLGENKMSNKIKAIMVNPSLGIISELEIDNSLESLQHAIGDHHIEAVYLDDKNVMYVDEEGLFRLDQKFFVYDGKIPLAGIAIVVGVNVNTGGTIGTTLNVTDIASKIGFHTAKEITAMGII